MRSLISHSYTLYNTAAQELILVETLYQLATRCLLLILLIYDCNSQFSVLYALKHACSFVTLDLCFIQSSKILDKTDSLEVLQWAVNWFYHLARQALI